MLSRYVVNLISIGGLVLGAFGPIYLSRGLFGIMGNWFLDLIFAVVLIGGFFAMVCQIQLPLAPSTWSFDLPRSLYWLEGLVLGLLIGSAISPMVSYFLAMDAASRRHIVQQSITQVLAAYGLAILLAVFVVPSNLVLIAANLGIIAITLAVALAATLFANKLSARRLRVTGLILTLTGIATQFLSSVLDLLNVKIV